MTVVFRLTDLLHELFPGASSSRDALVTAMTPTTHWGGGTIRMEGGTVVVELDSFQGVSPHASGS
jgi:hypothetical protein